jgi:hypothetical protein
MKDRTRHKRVAAYRSECHQQIKRSSVDNLAAKQYWLKCLLRGAIVHVVVSTEVGLIEPDHPLNGTRLWHLQEPKPDDSNVGTKLLSYEIVT